jgi:hypothetical protein
MKVYFDMDGVLTLLDNLLEENRKQDETRQDVIDRLSQERGHHWIFENAPTSPRLPEFREFMRKLKQKGHEVEILTSLGLENPDHEGIPGRIEGKKLWLGKNLGSELLDGVITKLNMVHSCEIKGSFGSPNAVLIDDQLHPNISLFDKNGGKGVHYKIEKHQSVLRELIKELL